jgi:DNA-binding MarR family transcriptional regulator
MSTNMHAREDLMFTLLETADRLERRLDRTLSNTRGISFREYLLLRTLSRAHQQAATRVDLAAAVGLTPSAVTRALRPLEKLGCVDTQKSERDARRSLASLTAAGAELLADAQGAVDDLLAGLDLDGVDHQALLAFLRGLGR